MKPIVGTMAIVAESNHGAGLSQTGSAFKSVTARFPSGVDWLTLVLPLAILLLTCTIVSAKPMRHHARSVQNLWNSESVSDKRIIGHWGPYLLAMAEDTRDHKRFRVIDRGGRCVREVRSQRIGSIDTVMLGDGMDSALSVTTRPEGNAVNEVWQYIFVRGRHGIRNLLIVQGGVFGDDIDGSVRDLDHDGHAELVVDSPAPLEYLSKLCHACCPSVVLIIGRNGHRYVLRNRHFARFARRKAREYRIRLMEAMRRKEVVDTECLASAIGYYANLWTIGEGRKARHWLMRRLPASARRLYLGSEAEVEARLIGMPKLIAPKADSVLYSPPYRGQRDWDDPHVWD
jgi:hypothetical protein